MRRTLALCVPGIAALALLAGCGSSSSSSSGSSSAAATPASTPTQSTATSTTASAGSGLAVATKHSKLGTILAAGPKHLTVYMFEADKGSTSSCSGACAKVWPAVTTEGKPSAAGTAVTADLGTTKRSDGTEQVTYKGHPLYFYDDDKDSGDAYGQGSKSFGAGWYVLKPDGSKIDEDSAAKSSGTSS
ncbi:MAG: COG4315 family predicted lipoprotein [Solirubrobacteraceae bacterium]